MMVGGGANIGGSSAAGGTINSGYLQGLRFAWVSATECSIAPGVARNHDNTQTMDNAATLTLDISVAGPVALGRDQAAAFAADGFIFAYLISGASGVSAIWSASEVAPTLPAGYSYYLKVGIGIMSSGSILQFSCEGLGSDRFYLFSYAGLAATEILNGGSATAWTTVPNTPTRVPPGVSRVLFQSNFDGSDVYAEIRPTGSALANGNGSVRLSLPDIGFVSHHFWCDVGTGRQVDYRINIDPTENLWLYVMGFMDSIGAFA